VVGVDENENQDDLPVDFALNQNYPNPFNPVTKISYSLSQPGLVSLKVFDMLGKEIATLVDGFQNAGNHAAEFNASRFASGVYFYRIEQSGNSITKKMTLLK
jgi:hypothetical protein